MIQEPIAAAIRVHLSPGEQVLWSGQPRQGVMFRPADVFMVPFSLLWGGFAIFWEWSVISMPSRHGSVRSAPWFFVLWGVPFVLVGLYMIVGRFFFDARQRARTVYALTSTRVLIVGGGWSARIQSINLRTLPDLSLTEGSDGRGTITLGPAPAPNMMTMMAPFGRNYPTAPQLDTIDNAARVYQMIRDAQERSSA